VAASQQAAEQKAALTIKDDQKLTLAFGRAREQRVRTVAFTVDGSLPSGTTSLHTSHSAFSRDGDDAQIPASDVKSRARVVGDEVQVDVCFDRAAAAVDPGAYVGTVTIDDPAVATTSVGMTLTFSFPCWSRVFALSLAVAFAASFYVFGLRSNRFTADAPQLLRRKTVGEYIDWVRSGNGLLTIVVGGAAGFAAYSAIYLQAEDWGTNPAQVLSLIGGIASGFVAAGTTGRLAAGGAPMAPPPAPEDEAPPPDLQRPPPDQPDDSAVPPTDEVPPADELPPLAPDDSAAPPTDAAPPVGAAAGEAAPAAAGPRSRAASPKLGKPRTWRVRRRVARCSTRTSLPATKRTGSSTRPTRASGARSARKPRTPSAPRRCSPTRRRTRRRPPDGMVTGNRQEGNAAPGGDQGAGQLGRPGADALGSQIRHRRLRLQRLGQRGRPAPVPCPS
jgi:hypothetical protein